MFLPEFRSLPMMLSCILLLLHSAVVNGLSSIHAQPINLPKSASSSTRCDPLQSFLTQAGVVVDGVQIQRYECATSIVGNDDFDQQRYQHQQQQQHERTVVATRDLSPGHVLIRIPSELGITAARSIAENQAAKDANSAKETLGTRDEDLLAIYLLSKCHQAEIAPMLPQDPYITSLPTINELQHIPLFWSDQDTSLLDGSECGKQLALRKDRETRFFQQLSKTSLHFAEIASDVKSWMWAKCLVQSRAFSIPNPNIEHPADGCCIGEDGPCEIVDEDDFKKYRNPKVPALFPMADMVNHAKHMHGCTCEWGVERESGDFVVRTISDVKSDAEVTISYGASGASKCLLNYGFVDDSCDGMTEQELEDSDYEITDGESAILKLTLDMIQESCDDSTMSEFSDPETSAGLDQSISLTALPELRKRVWDRDENQYADLGWKNPSERTVEIAIGETESALTAMSLIRVAVATEEELHELMANDYADDENNSYMNTVAAMIARQPLSWSNERRALLTLEKLMSDKLPPGNDDEHFDNQKMDTAESAMAATIPQTGDTVTGLEQNRRNALAAINAEQKVIHHWRDLMRMARSVLESRRDSFDFGLKYSKLFHELLGTTWVASVRGDDGNAMVAHFGADHNAAKNDRKSRTSALEAADLSRYWERKSSSVCQCLWHGKSETYSTCLLPSFWNQKARNERL